MFSRLWIVALLALGMLASPARAADFSVYPISPDFGGRTATSFTIANQSAKSLRAQIRIFRWTQTNGINTDTPTDELIASPPFVDVGGKESQTVRLLFRASAATDGERDYHVVVSELPEAVGSAPRQTRTLTTALSFSMPVFVDPPQIGQAQLAIEIQRMTGTLVQMSIANTGMRRAIVKSVAVRGPNGIVQLRPKGTATVLANGRITIALPADQVRALSPGTYAAEVLTEDKTYDATANIR